MKKDIMQKWVKALRSGKYKQTTETLKGKNGFCCLGVLCDLSKQGKWQSQEYRTQEGLTDGGIPLSVRTWAGINGNKGCGTISSLKKSLVYFNDVAKKNFNEIADIIEKHYKSL